MAECPHCQTTLHPLVPSDGGPPFEESGRTHDDARCRDVLAGQAKALRADLSDAVEACRVAASAGWFDCLDAQAQELVEAVIAKHREPPTPHTPPATPGEERSLT